jgi:hypothetical protein
MELAECSFQALSGECSEYLSNAGAEGLDWHRGCYSDVRRKIFLKLQGKLNGLDGGSDIKASE